MLRGNAEHIARKGLRSNYPETIRRHFDGLLNGYTLRVKHDIKEGTNKHFTVAKYEARVASSCCYLRVRRFPEKFPWLYRIIP